MFFWGIYFTNVIQFLDHWIAFVLLGFIGRKMIKDSLSKNSEEKKSNEYSFGFTKMFVLAFATSINALAIGIIFALFKINIFMAAITTFSISTPGVKIGNKFGDKFNSKAKFTGGTVLVILGIKILIEHLFFNNA